MTGVQQKKWTWTRIGKYASGIAGIASTVYCCVATVDYAGRWYNQAASAIQELGQVKEAIKRHETEQREDFKDLKRELGEMRQDVTRLLLKSSSPESRVRVAKSQDE